MITHDFTHPVDTTPPKVCVIVVYHREQNHPWLVELLDSLQSQSYPNLECITYDNSQTGHTIGKARNLAVQHTDAELCMFIAEEDMLVLDTIQSMVSMYQFSKSQMKGLVHVSTRCMALLENKQTVLVPDAIAPGMYERAYLLTNPFDEDLNTRVDAMQTARMENLAKLQQCPVTFATTHHFGYMLRVHPFRRDGISITPPR
jgi:hypothetical protein